MTNMIQREIPDYYQVVELQAGQAGQGRVAQGSNCNESNPRFEDPGNIEDLKEIEAFNEIDELDRFYNLYPAAAAAVTSSQDTVEVLDIFAQEIVRLLDADGCHVFKWEHALDQAVLLASYNSDDDERMLLDDQAYRKAIRPLIIGALTETLPHQFALVPSDGNGHRILGKESDARILLILPLTVRQRTQECVAIITTQGAHAYSQREIITARQFASQAAIAVENAQRYEASTASNSQLESVNQELEAFAHTVAHDLKSPLATVIGSAEFLKCSDGSWPQGDLMELTTIIVESSHKMLKIIDGLLLLSTFDQKDVKITEVDMEDALAETCTRLDEMLREKNAEVIVTSGLPASRGFRPWVEQVLTNLLSNAVKYGGQPPCIEIGAGKLHDDMIRYWVKDNGNGLTKEQQAELFQPFKRFHNKTISGHGLGLSIARRIVERLGGEIGVESKVGQGSIFFFTLPGIDA